MGWGGGRESAAGCAGVLEASQGPAAWWGCGDGGRGRLRRVSGVRTSLVVNAEGEGGLKANTGGA